MESLFFRQLPVRVLVRSNPQSQPESSMVGMSMFLPQLLDHCSLWMVMARSCLVASFHHQCSHHWCNCLRLVRWGHSARHSHCSHLVDQNKLWNLEDALGDTRDTGDRVRKWVRSVSVKSLKKWHYHWLTDWLTRPSYRDASASQICMLSIVFFWTCCAKQISENRWGRDGKNKDGDEEGWGDHSEISRLPFNDFWCCCLNPDPLGSI